MKDVLRTRYTFLFLLTAGCLLTSGCAFAYPLNGTMLMPSTLDPKTVFQTTQATVVARGFSVVQSNPDTGLISAQRKIGQVVDTLTCQVSTGSDKRVKVSMSFFTSAGLDAAPPPLVRGDMLSIAKEIAAKLGVSEKDVSMEF